MTAFQGGGSVPWWRTGRHGSRGVFYRKTPATDESELGRTVYLNSISCLPECSAKSHEELRWEDFNTGLGSTVAFTPPTSAAPNAAQPVWPVPTSAAPTVPADMPTQVAISDSVSNPASVTVEVSGDSGALITVRPDGSVRIEVGTAPGWVQRTVHEIGAGGQLTVRVLPGSQGQSAGQGLGLPDWQGQAQGLQQHAAAPSPSVQGEIKAPPGWFSQPQPSAFGGSFGAQQAPFSSSTGPSAVGATAAAPFGGSSAPAFASQAVAPFGSGGLGATCSTAAAPFGSSTSPAFGSTAAAPFSSCAAAPASGSTKASLFKSSPSAAPFGSSSGAPSAASAGAALPRAVPSFGFSFGTGLGRFGSSFGAPAFGTPGSSSPGSKKLGSAGKRPAGAKSSPAPSNACPFGAAPSNTGPFGAAPSNTRPFGAAPSNTGPSGAASPPAAASLASGFGFGAQSAWTPGSLEFGCFTPSSSAGLGGWAQGDSTSPTTHLDPAGSPGSGPEGGPGGSFPSSASPTGALRGLGGNGRSAPEAQSGPAKLTKPSPVKEEPSAEGSPLPAQPTPPTPSPSPSSSPAPFAVPILSFSMGAGLCFGGAPIQFGSSPQPSAQPGASKQSSFGFGGFGANPSSTQGFKFVAGSAAETAASCPSTPAHAAPAEQPPLQQQAQQGGSPAPAESQHAAMDGAASPAGASPEPPGASSAFPSGSPCSLQTPGDLGALALREHSMNAPASAGQPTPATPAETQALTSDEVEGQAPAPAALVEGVGAEVEQAQQAGAGGSSAGEHAGTVQDSAQQAAELGPEGHLCSPAEDNLAEEAGADKEGEEWEEVPTGN